MVGIIGRVSVAVRAGARDAPRTAGLSGPLEPLRQAIPELALASSLFLLLAPHTDTSANDGGQWQIVVIGGLWCGLVVLIRFAWCCAGHTAFTSRLYVHVDHYLLHKVSHLDCAKPRYAARHARKAQFRATGRQCQVINTATVNRAVNTASALVAAMVTSKVTPGAKKLDLSLKRLLLALTDEIKVEFRDQYARAREPVRLTGP